MIEENLILKAKWVVNNPQEAWLETQMDNIKHIGGFTYTLGLLNKIKEQYPIVFDECITKATWEKIIEFL